MSIDDLKKLSEKLSKVPRVCRYDTEEEPQCWSLAHMLTEFKQCSESINNEIVPKILEAKNNEEIEDQLIDIGEEFRFIEYLIQNSRFFDYIVLRSPGGDGGK